jgi:hypothetical protein
MRRQAIHFICRRDASGNFRNSRRDEATGLLRCGNWKVTAQEAEALQGGWVYLHTTKAGASELGGIVRGYEPVVDHEVSRVNRIEFLLDVRCRGKGHNWRGAAHRMAWTGGMVPADLPHESGE